MSACDCRLLLWRRCQEFLESGKMWEKQRNFTLAIQSYLSVTRSHSDDVDELVSIWQHAVRLASEHEKHAKYVEIADDVANRCETFG